MVDQVTFASGPPLLTIGLSSAPASPRPTDGGNSTTGTTTSTPTPGPAVQAAAVAQVNQHLQQAQPELTLQMDPGSGRAVFRVIQQDTGEVLLQVPSAEVLGMSRRVRELQAKTRASGTLVDRVG
jgi:uncharacterized FlaG/YvyC family protein